MERELIECGRDDGTAYAYRIYLCGNAEVICNEVDESGNGWKDEAAEAHGEAAEILLAAGMDYETDSCFAHYRGGERTGLVDVAWYRAEINVDDDGDEQPLEWCWCRSSLVPPSIAEPIESVAAKASDAMSATAQRLMDEANADRAGADE